MNHDQLRDWLQMQFDGELEGGRRADLDAHVAICAECAAERVALDRLGRTLLEGQLKVRPDFRSAVMAALPSAGWEARSARSWAWPAAMVVGFAVAAAAVLGGGEAAARGPVLGALEALFDLALTATQTGAGLLAASWQGVGLAVHELFGGSPLRLGVFGLGVLCLNLLFFRLLRRPAVELENRRR